MMRLVNGQLPHASCALQLQLLVLCLHLCLQKVQQQLPAPAGVPWLVCNELHTKKAAKQTEG